jgi:hypothetical protein
MVQIDAGLPAPFVHQRHAEPGQHPACGVRQQIAPIVVPAVAEHQRLAAPPLLFRTLPERADGLHADQRRQRAVRPVLAVAHLRGAQQPIEAHAVDAQPLAERLRGQADDHLGIAGDTLLRRQIDHEVTLLLGRTQGEIGIHPVGDVVADTRQAHAPPLIVGNAAALRRNPADRAVLVEQAIFRHQRAATPERGLDFPLDTGEIVGVEAAEEVGDRRAFRRPLRIDAIQRREAGIGGDPIVDDVPIPHADAVAGGKRQLQPLVRRLALPFGHHPRRRLAGDAEQPRDRAIIVEHGRVGERPPALLRHARTAQIERHVRHRAAFAGKRRLHQRRDIAPDITPHIPERAAERGSDAVAEDRAIGIVVEAQQIRPPRQEHRTRAGEHQRQRRAQRRRPALGRAEGRAGPVMIRNLATCEALHVHFRELASREKGSAL